MSGSKKILIGIAAVALAALIGVSVFAVSCLFSKAGSDSTSGDDGTTDSSSADSTVTDDNEVTLIEEDDTDSSDYTFTSSDGGTYVYTNTEGNTLSFTVTFESGTSGCYSVEYNTLTFSGITEDSVYTLTGTLPGNIVIDVDDSYELELDFTGFTVTSSTDVPVYIAGGDTVTLLAKKSTDNYIYDNRSEVDDDGISGCVYSLCDTNIQGKGNLYVKSANNNGIHTKKDLKVKNLTLQVECKDNALKGNDSVTISSGTVTLIATAGDGIKTTDSDVSSKGNQRGTVTISGGDVLIYAACDGIDAAYNVDISEGDSAPTVQVYTDKYSSYSEEVTATADGTYYVGYTSPSYKYSIRYFNDSSDEVWYNSGSSYVTMTTSSGGGGKQPPSSTTYYCYPITKPSGYANMQVFMYSSSQTQGQSSSYTAKSGTMSINDNYDTVTITKSGSSYSFSWTNYTTSNQMGGQGGPNVNMNDGNSDKGDYSTKGFKAANAIIISAGVIAITSYDDSIHANCDSTLENGDDPLGNVTITGGTLTLYSNDDGIHADSTAEISGGKVTITKSYEGVEGKVVKISDGSTSVISSDDGVNGTGTSGESIVISGGYLYVYAGGDGLDSNSTSSYDGLLISGGYTVTINTSSANSCIDTEKGYKYTDGYVLGVMPSGGMTSEPTTVSTSSISRATISSLSGYLTVANYVTVKMPSTMNAFVVFLGASSASISSASSTSLSLDSNGVCWSV